MKPGFGFDSGPNLQPWVWNASLVFEFRNSIRPQDFHPSLTISNAAWKVLSSIIVHHRLSTCHMAKLINVLLQWRGGGCGPFCWCLPYYLGKWSSLTNIKIVQMGWNHQLDELLVDVFSWWVVRCMIGGLLVVCQLMLCQFWTAEQLLHMFFIQMSCGTNFRWMNKHVIEVIIWE